MFLHSEQGKGNAPSHESRRGFLKSLAAIAVAGQASARARQKPSSPASGPRLAYVGTYSSPQGPEGAMGRGQGIYLFEMNPATGALAQRELFARDDNPAWLAFDPTRLNTTTSPRSGAFEKIRPGMSGRPSGREKRL